MAEVWGPIDYDRMARAVGRANRADLVVINLAVAHAGPPIPASLVAPPANIPRGLRVTILAKGAGVFALTFVFQDGSNITLLDTDIANGDILEWDFVALYVTNGAQPATIVRVIIDYRVIEGIGGL